MSYNEDLKKIAEYHAGVVEELCQEGDVTWDEAKEQSWQRLEESSHWRSDLKTNVNYLGIFGNKTRPLERRYNEAPRANGSVGIKADERSLTFKERMGAAEFVVFWIEESGNDFLPATFEALGAAAGYTPQAYYHGILKLREAGYVIDAEAGDGTATRSFWRVKKRPQNRAKKLAAIAEKLPKDDQDTLLSIIEELLNER